MTTVSSIEDKQNQIIAQFPDSLDWESKYKKIIEMGKRMAPLETESKIEKNIIKGCQSQVWLVADLEKDKGRIRFRGDSDALIVKGLVALLLSVYDNEKPNDILNSQLFFLDKTGLKSHLTPSRTNGLMAMVQQIKNYAIAFHYLLNKGN
ncbi:MAG: SufE family protein [Bdellovibrionaceae bacterium]|nr:SufE family protein [Pseudobdellovibrionaceae bacterium]